LEAYHKEKFADPALAMPYQDSRLAVVVDEIQQHRNTLFPPDFVEERVLDFFLTDLFLNVFVTTAPLPPESILREEMAPATHSFVARWLRKLLLVSEPKRAKPFSAGTNVHAKT
jgi:hypothetical protein